MGKLRLVVPHLNLGTHSLTAGRATMAANAEEGEDINERCLLRHGRWKSSLSKDGYVNNSVDEKVKSDKETKFILCFVLFFAKLKFESFS